MKELCANIKLNSFKVFACPEISLIMLFHNNLVVILTNRHFSAGYFDNVYFPSYLT